MVVLNTSHRGVCKDPVHRLCIVHVDQQSYACCIEYMCTVSKQQQVYFEQGEQHRSRHLDLMHMSQILVGHNVVDTTALVLLYLQRWYP